MKTNILSRESSAGLKSPARSRLGCSVSSRTSSPLRSPSAGRRGSPADSPTAAGFQGSVVANVTIGSRHSTPKRGPRMSLNAVSPTTAVAVAEAAAPAAARAFVVEPSADVRAILWQAGVEKCRDVPLAPRKVLLICNGDGSMNQRFKCELQSAGHDVTVLVPKNGAEMEAAAFDLNPDLIMCPFLTKFIPQSVYQKFTTIVVHPGPLGDGGPSSIDRAKRDQEQAWGVTLLEADDQWDAGPVWGHRMAPVPIEDPEVTKSVLYRNYLIPMAIDAMWEVMVKKFYGCSPLLVDHSDHSQLFGTYRSKLLPEDRAVDFSKMTAAEVIHTVAFSDSRPGATAILHEVPGEYALFNAWEEKTGAAADAAKNSAPGQVLGKRDGAVLVRCSDGSCVWIGQLLFVEPKLSGKLTCTNAASIKLPAAQVLSQSSPATVLQHLPGPDKATPIPFGTRPKTFQQVYTWQDGPTMYVTFDFYNGAMSTEQCQELRNVLEAVNARPDVRGVVLLGSKAAFSNGVHLNVIEAAADPAYESWRNISAIDDAIRAAFSMPDKLVVAAVQANAGAGGAMMALAADLVWCQEDVVLNPHYKAMGLFGSEYWTHFLPARVGADMAEKLTNMCQPITARQAAAINFCDASFDCPKDAFVGQVRSQIQQLWSSGKAEGLISKKQAERTLEWYAAAERCRAQELAEMSQSFASAEYVNARKAFVSKKGSNGFKASASPLPPLAVHSRDLLFSNVVPATSLHDEVDEDIEQEVSAGRATAVSWA